MKSFIHRRSAVLLLAIISLLLLTACSQTASLPSQMLNREDRFSLELTYLGEIPRTDDFRILQGGCVTEDFAYFAMLSEKNSDAYSLSKCYIIKYDRTP